MVFLATFGMMFSAFAPGSPVLAQGYEGDPAPMPFPAAPPRADLVSRVLAERQVEKLPAGALFWRLERFASAPQVEEASGAYGLPFTDSAGGAWTATLGSSAGFADVGPLSPVVASAYLLRVTEVTGTRGSTSPVQRHPGTAAIYVLAGELCIRTAAGRTRIPAGQTGLAPAADTVLQTSSCGAEDLRALVLSVTDADRPFTSPAQFPQPVRAPQAPSRESPGYEPVDPH